MTIGSRSLLITAAAMAVIAMVVLAGCSDDDEGPVGAAYEGYTLTDEEGTVLAADDDDWVACTEEWEDPGMPPLYPQAMPAYPNGTNRRCVIEFVIPRSAAATMSIWRSDPDGQILGDLDGGQSRVATLFDGVLGAGRHRVVWYGRNATQEDVPPGLYRCVFEVEDCTTYGDIMILDCPYDTERLLTDEMIAYLDEHWSLEKLDAAYDYNYLTRPDADPDFAYMVATGIDYFGVDDYRQLLLWVDRDDDLALFVENVAMWQQFVFGFDDYRDPRGFLETDEVDIGNLADPRTSAHREVLRGNE